MDYYGPLTSDGARVYLADGRLAGTDLRDRGRGVVDFARADGAGRAFVRSLDITRVSHTTPAPAPRPAAYVDPAEVAELLALRTRALEHGFTVEDVLAEYGRDQCASLRARLEARAYFEAQPAAYWQRERAAAATPALPTTSFEALSASYWARAAQ